jgi:hypothetical protein
MISARQFKLSPNIGLFALPLLTALIVTLFGYQTTMAEPDLVRMMASMVYRGATGGPIVADHHYGTEFSFGFYQVLYAVLPKSALLDPDQVARAINQLGLVMAFLFALGVYLMLEQLSNRKTALFCTVIFLFCPLTLPFLASAHPMIGACASLFLACWLLLRSLAYPATRDFLYHMAPVFLLLLFSLTLRADIALAFPFVGLAWWVKSPLPWQQRLPKGCAIFILMLLAVVVFLYLQRPFVSTSGGALNSLGGYISAFSSLNSIMQGLAVVVLSFGSASTLWLAVALALQLKPRQSAALDSASSPLPMLLLLVPTLALILPSLLFWIAMPQPARHFIIPVFGLCILLGVLWSPKLRNPRHALLLAALLVMANQLVAEFLLRPPIVSQYHWSYHSDGVRRVSQRMPLGLFPLDQKGNLAAEAVLKNEAMQMARKAPNKLIILGDNKYYLIAHLLATDPNLRLNKVKIGNFNALSLSHQGRIVYLLEKYTAWPKDVLSEVLNLPEFMDYPVYVQKTTATSYDKTQVPAGRKFVLE